MLAWGEQEEKVPVPVQFSSDFVKLNCPRKYQQPPQWLLANFTDNTGADILWMNKMGLDIERPVKFLFAHLPIDTRTTLHSLFLSLG